jgi:hypothetical protein
MKVFDALVNASRKEQKSADGGTKYNKFVEVGDDLLATVLLCMAEGGTERGIKKQVAHMIEKLIFQSTWSKDSPLKKREDAIKKLLRLHVHSGKLVDGVKNEMSKLISKYYTYVTGVISVSFESIRVLKLCIEACLGLGLGLGL